jgi:hypothetical protein
MLLLFVWVAGIPTQIMPPEKPVYASCSDCEAAATAWSTTAKPDQLPGVRTVFYISRCLPAPQLSGITPSATAADAANKK